MSLQVWLPLNGDLNNQGLGNITTISGNPTYKNGKVTSKSLNLNQRIYFTCPQLANLQTFSVCFWGMTENSSTLTTNWQDLIGFTDVSSSGTNGIFRWETCYGSTGTLNGIHWHDNATNALVNGSVYHNTSRNEWCHCCVVFDAEHGKIYSYSNGELKGTHTYLGGHFNANGKFYLGETNNIEGRIQDVRFYDHALSPKEVKELAKGLVLHYRLAGPGQENLLNGNTHLASAWTQDGLTVSNYSDSQYSGIKLVSNSANGRVYNSVANVWLTNGAEYSVSFMAKSDTAGTSIDMSRSIADFSQSFTLTTNWKYYTGTIKITNTSNGGTLSIRVNQASRNVYIANLKLENGTIATSYCPPVNSTLYTAMGYNNNIEYDCSIANIYEGTKIGTFKYSSDTPRYSTSTIFTNSANQYIYTPALTFLDASGGFTFSGWAKQTSKTTISGTNTAHPYQFIISQGRDYYSSTDPQSYGVSIFANNGQIMAFIGKKSMASNIIFDQKSWYHIVLTYDGTAAKLYVNGVETKTENISSSDIFWTNNTGNKFVVGKMSHGYTNTDTYFPFVGGISDVRIYATALSVEDIAELYHSAVIVDNTGKSYAYEYFEAN